MRGGERRLDRRAFLGLAVATAGCTGIAGRSRPVTVLAAGSLQPTLADLQDRTAATVEAEAMGSAAAARLVAAGKRDPDVLALADTALFDGLGDWYDRIATNELAVAYTAETAGGRAVGDADRWYQPLLAGEASLGRTDPALDPLGYRTLFMADLAAAHYDRPDFADALLRPGQVYPETGLLSQFESGSVDAAVVYRSMAVDRDYPAIDLPAAIDLSAPAHADSYATTAYELPDGTTVRGSVIDYGATRRRDANAVRSVYDTLVDGPLLADHGFGVPAEYPVRVGATAAD